MRGPGDEIGSADTLAAIGDLTTPSERSDLPASLVGEVFAHRYRILRLLGTGGMGAVYMARDHELDDIVALKTIRSTTDQALVRIRREVKLARRVTHRNVARTFELGEHSGERFLTMEYIDGEPLSMMLRRHGRLPQSRAVTILRAVCSGLTAAHDAGVIHRDIKPDNVMIARDGRVVITDFGIAVAGLGGGAAHIAPSGTPAYMSPEQVESGEVTVASDVYSTGVMAYQLLTGELPWNPLGPTETTLARLTQSPRDPRALVPELSDALAEVIMRALARQPEQRFASVAALGTALGHAGADDPVGRPVSLTSPPGTPEGQEIPRRMRRKLGIAVLPFVDHGASTDDYLLDGLVEELTDSLCRVRELRVMSRGALARFDPDQLQAHEVGTALGVDVVLEGSVRRQADDLRVSVRAIQVEDQVQLWAERFTARPEQVLALAEQLVSGLSEALALNGSAVRRELVSNADAVELYLRARQEYQNPSMHLSSLSLFSQAHTLDPDNPLINAGLALALVRRWFFLASDTEHLIERAHEVAQKALRSAPELGEPHLALAQLYFNLGDTTLAAREARAAIAKSPSCTEAHELLGRMLFEMGRLDEGRRRFDVARELGHHNDLLDGELFRIAALAGDWEFVDKTRDQFGSDRLTGRLLLVRVHAYRGDDAALREHARLLDGREPDQAGALRLAQVLIPVYLREAPPSNVYMMLQPDNRETSSKRRIALAFQVRAEVAGFAGDDDIAMQSLHVAEAHSLFDLFWLDNCPLLDRLREREDFRALRERIAERCHAIYDAMWS